MPSSVLIFLFVLVGVYGVLAAIGALGFLLARHQDAPPPPGEWPTISVTVPAAEDSEQDTIQQIRDCDYPADRLDLRILSDDAEEGKGSAGTDSSVGWSDPADVGGDIVLKVPPGGTPASEWPRSMGRHCTPETPVVVGPTVVEHEDLFLPRLQALSHLGRLVFTAGASHLGIPTAIEATNRAIHVDACSSEKLNKSSSRAISPAINLEPKALVTRPPVGSFETFFRRLTRGFRAVIRSPSWVVWGQGIGLWLLHSVLLACSLMAVALPAWRQPTLVALLATMGADVLLALPAASHYGQRGLLRSLVPTVLMLVVVLPLAGLWALLGPLDPLSPVRES